MAFNINTIIKAWAISFNPTDKQLTLAKERGSICESCEFRGTKLTIPYCKECGCPISKKIFTNEYNPCPKEKWEIVDIKHFGKPKTKNTLI